MFTSDIFYIFFSFIIKSSIYAIFHFDSLRDRIFILFVFSYQSISFCFRWFRFSFFGFVLFRFHIRFVSFRFYFVSHFIGTRFIHDDHEDLINKHVVMIRVTDNIYGLHLKGQTQILSQNWK